MTKKHKKIMVSLSKTYHTALKIRAAAEDRTMAEIISDAIEKYLGLPLVKEGENNEEKV